MTNTGMAPTLEQWRRLYDAAALFKQCAPWNWLTDEHLFAVEDPETAAVAYCSILGAGDIEYGLVAYRGGAGLKSFALMLNDALDEDEQILVQDCLTLLFGEAKHADKSDRAVHSSLGLRFRGKGAWPLLRSHVPTYVSRHVDAREAGLLATSLEQACAFVDDILSGTPLPELPDGEHMLLRQRDSAGTWQTVVTPFPEPAAPVLDVTPARLSGVLADCHRTGQTWEVKLLVPGPIEGEDGQPSFFARLLLCVDHESGLILPGSVLAPEDSIQDALLEVAEGSGMIPSVLMLTSEYLASELEPLAEALQIEVRPVAELRQAEAAAQSLREALGGQH